MPGKDDSEDSLAASSVIMPHTAPERSPTLASQIPPQDEATSATQPSAARSENSSDISLVDVPSSLDGEDLDGSDSGTDSSLDVFEDSRTHFASTPATGADRSPDVEYVVLYDSSGEE